MSKTKKTLVSLFVVLTMLLSVTASMVTVNAAYAGGTVLYSNDVESGAIHAGGTTVATDPTDNTNNCAKYNGGWYGVGLNLSQSVSSGILQVKFDYLTNATGSSFHLDLAGSERSGKNLLTLIRRSGTTMEGAAGTYGTFETNKWYTVDTIIDFDTKHYVSSVKEKASGTVIRSVDTTLSPTTAEYSGWPYEISTFTMLFFSGGSSDEYLDNISAQVLTVVPEEETLYSNDVESGAIHAGGTTVATDPTDNTNNCAKYNGSWYGVGLDLSKSVSSGIVQVQFDYMTQATTSSFHLDLAGSERSEKNLLTLIRRNGTTMEGAAGVYGTFETNKWYTVNVVVNLDTKHYMSVVKEKATNTVINNTDTTLAPSNTSFTDWPATINTFTMLFFSGGNNTEYLDNILVKTLLAEPEPEPTEETLYSNDVESGAIHAGGTTVATDPTDNTNNCAKYNGSWYGVGLDLSKSVSSGIVQVQFDYMTQATTSSFHLDLAGSERSEKNLLTLIRRNTTTMEGAAGVYGTFETNKWYTVNVVVNLDTKHYMSVVKEKATNTVINNTDTTLAPSNTSFTDWPAEINTFTMLFFSGGNNTEYLDNILVKTLLEEPEPEATEEVLYSNNVESGALHAGGTTVITDPSDSSNHYAKYNGSWYGAGLDLSKSVSSGIVQITFDYMANSTASSFHFDLAGSERSGKNLLTLIRRNGTVMEGAAGNYGVVTTGKWYTIDTFINIDTKHYVTAIKEKSSGDVLKVVEDTLAASNTEYSDWPAEINTFTMLFFSGGSNEEYLDNVLVKKLLAEPAVPTVTYKSLLYSNDYESGSAPSNATISTEGSGNRYLTLSNSWSAVQYKFDKVTKNKIMVKFDFMNTASNSSFYAALLDSTVSTSDGAEQLVLIRDQTKMECYSSTQNRNILGDHIDNVWLTYEAIIDIHTMNCVSKVSYKSTGETIAMVDVDLSPSNDNLADWPKTATGFDTFMITSGRAGGTHIDNLVIEKVVGAPTTAASRITIKDSLGVVQNIWTDVSPATKTFHIDFSTDMDTTTITTSTVYVTEKDSLTPLSASISFVDGIAVLTLADNQLTRNKEYVLHISEDVENVAGDALGEDAAYSFTVNAGEISAVMGTPVVGVTSDPSFASLSAGDVVEVPITYINTTGANNAVKIIAAYYKNNGSTLADVEFISVPFSTDVANAQYTFEHTFKSVQNADTLRIMLWNGFDTLVPLAASVEID